MSYKYTVMQYTNTYQYSNNPVNYKLNFQETAKNGLKVIFKTIDETLR